jgi:NADPH-dependent 2,4-dienoyl-CoA reductase/sulfur reductase-like enzyme
MGVLIVGASLGGVRTAQALRLHGYEGEITLLGAERHVPYDRPPLSKEMLQADGTADPVPILSPDDLGRLDLALRLGTTAVALDPVRKVVTTAPDQEITYSKLVIATGVSPRTLPGADALHGVHTLRNAEDAIRLRQQLGPGRRAVVVGAGFIGAEFAAAARTHGVEVTMIEAQEAPLAHVLGPRIGKALTRLHEVNGVTVHAGVQVDHFHGEDRVEAVVLSDGQEVPADVVVVGIGARPATHWLVSSGLPIPDGVDCDESLRVLGFPDVYAAGDVARWRHPLYGEPVRIEHWTNTNDHAAVIAADILGRRAPTPTLPYVWSDQYGKRIQIVGRPALGTPMVTRGEMDTGNLMACFADAEDALVGALVVDDPRLLMRFRKAILNGMNYQEFEQSVMAVS